MNRLVSSILLLMIGSVMCQDFWTKIEDEMNKNREHSCVANCFNLGGSKPGSSRTQPDCIIDVRSISSDCDDLMTKNKIDIIQTDTGRYSVGKDKKNWHEASRWCRMNGLQLLSIETLAEHQQLAEKVFPNVTTSDHIWISGCDHVTDNQWYWVETGEDITDYKNWDTGVDPNNSVKKDILRCVFMRNSASGGGFKWAIEDCMSEKKFICEMPELCFKQYCNTN